MANERRRQLLLTASLWLVVMGGAGSFASCYGHNCDGSFAKYGLNPGEGELVTPDVWESSPQSGDAIPYTRERTWSFEIQAFADRTPYLVIPYVSADQNVSTVNGNETVGSGNLAEISGVGPGRFTVRNDTCADYFVRVVAMFPPATAAAASPGGDGGVTPEPMASQQSTP